MRLWLRSNSLVPTLSSSFASCWESEGWARPSCLLARVSVEDCATAMKIRSWCKVIAELAAARRGSPRDLGAEHAAFPKPWQGPPAALGRPTPPQPAYLESKEGVAIWPQKAGQGCSKRRDQRRLSGGLAGPVSAHE